MKIDQLRVRNFRVLRDVEFKDLTQLTVLCGANGSGKSTVFDVFAFLNQVFTEGLRPAWDDRQRIGAIRSRGASGPVQFDLAYRAKDFDNRNRLVRYHLAVDQDGSKPVVVDEELTWNSSPGSGRPRQILRFQRGEGFVYDEATGERQEQQLASPDLLAVSALGQLRQHPRVVALRNFIQGWYLSYVSADRTRDTPAAGPEAHLSRSGDNLANVVQYLDESHRDVLDVIFAKLQRRVPRLERVLPTQMEDGRLLLQLKDVPFEDPVLSRFASDGTLKLLAYLTVLEDPDPFEVIGIEEPENQLHPTLLPVLAEEIRAASADSQVLVTTHSPEFMGEIRGNELWIVSRAEDGFARVRRADSDPRVRAQIESGADLGWLWTSGYLLDANPAGV